MPVRSAVAAAESADFHWHLARADRDRCLQGGSGAPQHWRWRVRRPHSRPPILLSAFLIHLFQCFAVTPRIQS